MNYLPLSEYRHAWFFNHQEMAVSESDLAKIKPLTPKRAFEIWELNISQHTDDPSEFTKDDWASQNDVWQATGFWQGAWDSDDHALPEALEEFIHWEANTVVYFCYSSEHIVETTWDIFKRYWKNFLFLDDGPLLIGRKRKEVAQFKQNGSFSLGLRP